MLVGLYNTLDEVVVVVRGDVLAAEAASWRAIGDAIERRGGRLWDWVIWPGNGASIALRAAMMVRLASYTAPDVLSAPLRTRGERALAAYLLAEVVDGEVASLPAHTRERS